MSASKFRVCEFSPRHHSSTDAIIGCNVDPVAYAMTARWAMVLAGRLNHGQSGYCDGYSYGVQERVDGRWQSYHPVEINDAPALSVVCGEDEIPF